MEKLERYRAIVGGIEPQGNQTWLTAVGFRASTQPTGDLNLILGIYRT